MPTQLNEETYSFPLPLGADGHPIDLSLEDSLYSQNYGFRAKDGTTYDMGTIRANDGTLYSGAVPTSDEQTSSKKSSYILIIVVSAILIAVAIFLSKKLIKK